MLARLVLKEIGLVSAKKNIGFQTVQTCTLKYFFLLNCELIDQCRTCRCLLGWILEILEQKWDTIRFIEFELALLLAKELKFFVMGNTATDYYRQNKETVRTICKKARISCNLDVILENNDFFKDGDDRYMTIRSLIFNKIRTGFDLYNVDNVDSDLSNFFKF